MVVNEEDQMIIDNIEEYVNVENKIVSFKWLSLNLSIHVNKAKSLLEDYYDRNRTNINATYFIAGSTASNKDGTKNFEYKLVKGESVEETKKGFENVTSCHVYSLQKSELKDSSTLYNTDIDIIKENLHKSCDFNTITCPNLKISNNRPKSENGTQPNTVKTEILKETLDNTSGKPVNKTDNTQKRNKKTDSKSAPPLSFFGKKTTGKTTETKIKQDDKKDPTLDKKKDPSVQEPKSKSQKSDIASAFSHASEKTKRSEVKDEMKNEKKEDLSKDKKEATDEKLSKASKKRKDVVNDSESEDEFENFVKQNKEPKSKITSSVVNKTVEDVPMEDDEIDVVAPTPEPVKQKAKRRRKNDSTNESKIKDTVDKIEKEDTETDTPHLSSTKHPSPVTVTTSEETSLEVNKPSKTRGRRRILKSKQYIDEEGFMVTRKECVIESFSEEDDENPSEEKLKTMSEEKKKQVEVKKGFKDLEKKSQAAMKKSKHQSSMMDFFKKK